MCHPEVPPGMPVPEVERSEVDVELDTGERMPALLARPGPEAAPPVLVVADIFGRSPFYEALAARLASAGFRALLPDPFFRQGPLAEPTREAALARRSRLDQNRTLDDLRRCLDWLRSASVPGARVGTVGFCMGGTLVLDLAAVEPDLVTVCYYGFPAGSSPQTPFSPPVPMQQVKRMRGPILGFWGDQDAGVGPENVAAFAAAMAAAGKDFDHRLYAGLGHGFLAASGLESGGPGYREACESWTLALEHWRRHLAPGAESLASGRASP